MRKKPIRKYHWTDEERAVSEQCTAKGWMMTADAFQEMYTIYDDPELKDAWTIKNVLIWSHNLQDLKNYLLL